ncbi:MAG: nuclear transport factor 2 family protein [Acidimicrobiia bacterium]|nr:nuclear transport factor 2 family protein [Acidimicrobiia bacterium]
MKNSLQWFVTALLLLTLGHWIGTHVGTVSAQDRVSAEVRKALEDYVANFSAKRADLIAEQNVLAPSTLIGGTAVTTSLTAADVKHRYETNLNSLVSQKYGRSQVKNATVCALNDSAAIVSGQFTRYRTDGSVLSELASTYVFAKSDGRWRIVTQIGHSLDRRMTCGA